LIVFKNKKPATDAGFAGGFYGKMKGSINVPGDPVLSI
jgi:hypothetical protein